jgi:glyoxylase-like metal-dependent hydrolase (beta-lactamase superfamily II)
VEEKIMEIETVDLGGVNAFLVKTDAGFVLFDSGFANKRAVLQKGLDEAGVNAGNLKLVVFTHGDIDHTGNGLYLRQKYGVKLAIHPLDRIMVEEKKFHEDRHVKSIPMKIMHTLFKAGFKKMMAGFEPFSPDLLLEDGQDLKAYGLDGLVLHTPGHTDGSICIYLPNGDLIAGDIFQNRGSKPKASIIVKNEAQLAASLAKLSTMDIKRVYPGHGKPFLMSQFTH